jgi:PAS domain S-box-containing protein
VDPDPSAERQEVGAAQARSQSLSEARFRTMAGSAPVGIFETDAQGETTFVNQRWCEISGLAAGLALGHGWLDAVHPDDRPILQQGWQGAEPPARETRAHYRFVRPDGDVRWVEGRAIEIFDDAGRLSGYVGVVIDKTVEILAERGAEFRRRIHAASSETARAFLSGDWRVSIDASLAALGAAAGADRVTVVEEKLSRRGAIARQLAGDWARPSEVATADAAPSDRPLTPDDVADSAWRPALERGEVVLLHATRGLPRDVLRDEGIEHAILDRHGLAALVLLPIRVRGAFWGWMSLESRSASRGAVSWTEADAETLRVAVDTLAAAIERHRVDEALGLSERRFRDLFENSPVPVWEMDFSRAKELLKQSGFFDHPDPAGFLAAQPALAAEVWRRVRFVDANRPALRLLGVESREELLANLDRLSDPRILHDSLCELVAMHRGETRVRFETRTRNVRGEELDLVVNWLVQPGREEDARSVLVSVHDVTEQKRIERELRDLERQLEQGRRMETVGRLAGGIAHDFNNLLTVILGSCEMLALGGAGSATSASAAPGASAAIDGEATGRELRRIRSAGERATALTRQLLAFSRRQVLKPTTLDLNQLVRDTQSLLARLLPEDVSCVLELCSAPTPVVVDQGQYEQVLMNLVLNSRDAMPEGGTIRITTAVVDAAASERWSGRRPQPPRGDYVVLTVRDSGPGLTDEALERCFEPFYTTKATGRGTGLGLSTAFGIVRQSEGFLWAANARGGGALFEVVLPRARAEAGEPGKEPPAARNPGTKSILLVEDNGDVRLMVRALLESLGHEVVDTGFPREALNWVREGLEVDLLLSDVVMPELTGDLLREEVLRLRPGLPTLLMSGYADDVLHSSHASGQARGVGILQKPFTVAALTAALDGAFRAAD